ncbi:GMC oxidoreductase [Lasiosphaeris hirsuta]|uniref:GMC oxidoreductase n=1 Tax=Lasiosphaeris hirsuta TaxID=260670 RepID=A0AA40A9S1_9PEZI|nr:GMC oxidoreductase [Lasiosphaeris hirsuta]
MFTSPLAAWVLFAGISSPLVVAGGVHHDYQLLRDSYDYIIAGGGLTGLVVANRLTEDSNVTVLVVEYGDFDDSWDTAIPYYADQLQNKVLMFQQSSAEQKNLENRTFTLSLGMNVGGGSAVNEMYMTRGQTNDYDAWEELGNSGWGWAGLQKYFKKSTTLDAPSDEVKAKNKYKFSTASYGNGPVKATFPPWQWPDTYTLNDAWTKDLGFEIREDGGTDGGIIGVSWKPISADGKNLTRSSARTAYYDPAASRPNLDILVENYVARVNTKDSKVVGVDIIARINLERHITLPIRKEVILAAGAIHTPQILQLSGIGAADLLESLNITVAKDLPGVGANYQDHPTIKMEFSFTSPSSVNPSTLTSETDPLPSESALDAFLTNRTGPFTSAHGNTRAVLSLSNLTTSSASLIQSLYDGPGPETFLPQYYADHPDLIEGYKSQSFIVNRMIAGDAGLFEVSWAGDARINFAAAKPLSRGTVLIESTNPHPEEAAPRLDFGALAHPFDTAVGVLGVKLGRKFVGSPALKGLSPAEVSPGAAVVTDAQVEEALRGSLFQPHGNNPCCTAAMMPQGYGGVVDEELRVYGIQGLRIVDASVLPLIPVAGLQATLYAVAERAADIIKGGVAVTEG